MTADHLHYFFRAGDRNNDRMEKLRQYMRASKENGNKKQGLEKTEPLVSGIQRCGLNKKDTLTGWDATVFGLQRQQKE